MGMFTRRIAQLIMVTLCTIFVTSVLFAASPLVWEGEQVKGLSGRAFKIQKLTKDPTGKVSGNKVIGIDKVAKGQKVASDSAAYRVNIPANGTYYLWARLRWSNGCGNSFLMTISGIRGNWILGGDGTYEALHWLSLSDGGRPRALPLKKGVITFTLGAKESGAMADQFLLTTDRRYVPAGTYKATANLLVM